MRNWNIVTKWLKGLKRWVFTVPMRNWNLILAFAPWHPAIVFTVPMRNWNLQVLYLLLCSPPRFYSTYEELKQKLGQYIRDVRKSFLQYLWGIETCTPGIFFHTHSKFLQYLWGIETKKTSFKISYSLKVFTVPMRNWNPEAKTLQVKIKIVFTVPMRNWNLLCNI